MERKVTYRIAVKNQWGDTNDYEYCSESYEDEEEALEELHRLIALGRHKYKLIELKEKLTLAQAIECVDSLMEFILEVVDNPDLEESLCLLLSTAEESEDVENEDL